MSDVALKQEINTVLERLTEPKLAVVLDFVQYLAERETRLAWFNATMQSSGYQEWLSSENDIYDEVFADALPTQ